MIKRLIQKDLTIVNTYAPKIGTPKYKANINKHKGRN